MFLRRSCKNEQPAILILEKKMFLSFFYLKTDPHVILNLFQDPKMPQLDTLLRHQEMLKQVHSCAKLRSNPKTSPHRHPEELCERCDPWAFWNKGLWDLLRPLCGLAMTRCWEIFFSQIYVIFLNFGQLWNKWRYDISVCFIIQIVALLSFWSTQSLAG